MTTIEALLSLEISELHKKIKDLENSSPAGVYQPPYKIYSALLNQTGTNAPTAIILENTLSGAIVWTRLSSGEYIGTLAGAFINNKTALFININPTNHTDQLFAVLNRIDLNSISLKLTLLEDLTDYPIVNNLIEIRVYN